MLSTSVIENHMSLQGPAGNLEVVFSSPKENVQSKIAIICHPHPLFGGTMNNKVVSTLARTFHELGMHAVRFNFRGVGKSEGQFDEGVGEFQDLLTVIDWVRQHHAEKPLWLAGFSFGGYIAARAATQIPAEGLVTVAPQASRFIAEPFPPILIPWILVQGDADEVVPPAEVYAWIDSLERKPILIRMPDASHFFHGKLMELREKLTLAIKEIAG